VTWTWTGHGLGHGLWHDHGRGDGRGRKIKLLECLYQEKFSPASLILLLVHHGILRSAFRPRGQSGTTGH
jgi:hypothetical protein